MKKVAAKINGEQKLLYCDIDGNFPNHHPDPSEPENLIFCKKEIINNDLDLGIAFDGDGDRIGVVDDKEDHSWGYAIVNSGKGFDKETK